MTPDPAPVPDDIADLRTAARAAASGPEPHRSVQLYSEILACAPDDLEAVEHVASAAMAAGAPARAVAILELATHSHPDDPDLLRALGIASRATGDLEGAVRHLRRACAFVPTDFTARLILAASLQALGRADDALPCYFGALMNAQSQGLWTDERTTPAELVPLVLHAAAEVREKRPAYFSVVFQPMRDRHGAAAMRRIEQGLQIYLNEVEARYADPRQRPLFFYVPGLPPTPYFDRSLFDWIAPLEAMTADIREELLRVIERPDALEPFHRPRPGGEASPHLGGVGGKAAAWDTYFFCRHGEPFQAHLESCPVTASALSRLPLSRVRDHAPETLFSILRPGTHILPHRGVTNTRVVAHLPLVVPDDCAIVVGGEQHVWCEGEVVVFDDTFEHEAWNRSDRTRAILLMDVWNPYLDAAERDALMHLIPMIGDFNRAGGIP